MGTLRITPTVLTFACLVLAAGCGGGGSGSTQTNPQPPTPPSTTPPPTLPQLTITTTSLSPAFVGKTYSQQFAASNGTLPLTWSAPKMMLASLTPSSSGLLSGTPSAPYCRTSITITVTDSSTPAQSASANLLFNAEELDVSLGNGQVGASYLHAITFDCSTAPVSWSLVSGSLPPGLQMQPFPGQSAQLNIQGTPTQAGTFNFTVQGVDGLNQTLQQSASITVMPPPLAITDSSVMQLGVVSQPFDHVPTTTGGTPPFSFTVSSGSLAPGLKINANTGEVSGTPTAAGYYQFNIQVTDRTTPTPFSAQKSYTMLVTPSPLSGRNDSIATATPIFPGTYVASLSPYVVSSGRVAPDQDYYSLVGNGGDTYSIGAGSSYTDPKTSGPANSSADTAIEILDSTGTRMVTCNDPIADNPPSGAPITKGTSTFTDACVDHGAYNSGSIANAALTVKLPTGSNQTFYIHVFDFQGRARLDFIYTLTVTKLP